MNSIPPVKDPFNITPEEEALVLSYFNGEFKGRFTDGDRAFQMALTKGQQVYHKPIIVCENYFSIFILIV